MNTMNSTIERVPPRSSQKIHFEDEQMDFHLSQFMGYATFGGAQHGECLRAASQIDDGNPQSWVAAWRKQARQVEARAQATLEEGHLLSARDAYLRASTYYRAALVFLHPRDRRYLDLWEDMRSCFRMATALFNPPIVHIDVPFEGKTLPGYFRRAYTERTPNPTLIMIGGGETFAEELYFWAAAPGALRGYNTLCVELPGQGSTPHNGLFYRVDSEIPMKAVVDYALGLPGVDPDRLYVYGVSGGGYMTARAAAFDKRIKACVLNAPVTNVYRLLTARLVGDAGGDDRPGEPILPLAERSRPRGPAAELLFDKLCWQSGTTSLSEALAVAKLAQMGDLTSLIECPTLCLVSEGEIKEQSEQAREFYNDLTAPKQMRVFTADEGAEAHCQVNNLSLMHAAVFDWLDEL